METKKTVTILVLVLGFILCQAKLCEAAPIGTAFTYQGYLYDANHPANDIYDLQFKLYDTLVGGGQVGSDVNTPDVDVIDGSFTVGLDFGSGVFTGNARWLEIAVRSGDSNDRYTTLSPRQETTPVPYASYSSTAGTTNWSGVEDVPSDLIDGDDVGIVNETDPTVLESVKDGVSWGELIGIPAGFADGVDDTGGNGTYYWSCVGANFHPQYNATSSTEIKRDPAYIEAEATGIFFFAPVMLPHGAIVTKVVVYGNVPAEDWAFRRIALNSTSMSVVANAKIGTEATLSHTINNNTYAYVLWTSSLDSGGVIYNARITYTK